ncbi:MAG: hypothetical protein LC659_15165 [Myxococcales bacterium]|nr:hypothetical protein [Myxococcales bacterium]
MPSALATVTASVALARLYATVPFGSLPRDDRTFVTTLVGEDAKRVHSSTPVMSLLGTRGAAAEWNDRKRSNGHRAIPLIDSRFVDALPMVARMLTDLGVDAQLFDAPEVDTRRFIGGLNGLFYVEDARSAVDKKGRRIIPAETFVQKQGIRTVFGMGGSYLGGEIAVAIFFCKELVSREAAERFALLIHQFKLSTTQLVGFGKIFE